jgi:hypothetical protein
VLRGLSETKPTPRAIRDRASTLRDTPAVNVAPLDQALVVVVNGVVSTHPLPALGMLTLGRARECDIQIVDPSVSRNHARIRVGSVITIEDLKSANGTRLRGEPLLPGKPVAFTPGESVELGSAIVMLRRRAAPTREWRIWAHGYFEARLEDECARAARTSLSYSSEYTFPNFLKFCETYFPTDTLSVFSLTVSFFKGMTSEIFFCK